MRYLIRYPLPAKNTLFLLFTEIFRRHLAKLAVCNVVFPDFCICPQYEYNGYGGALVPLRSGLVQTGCQKSGKTTADISDNARAALCKQKK